MEVRGRPEAHEHRRSRQAGDLRQPARERACGLAGVGGGRELEIDGVDLGQVVHEHAMRLAAPAAVFELVGEGIDGRIDRERRSAVLQGERRRHGLLLPEIRAPLQVRAMQHDLAPPRPDGLHGQFHRPAAHDGHIPRPHPQLDREERVEHGRIGIPQPVGAILDGPAGEDREHRDRRDHGGRREQQPLRPADIEQRPRVEVREPGRRAVEQDRDEFRRIPKGTAGRTGHLLAELQAPDELVVEPAPAPRRLASRLVE